MPVATLYRMPLPESRFAPAPLSCILPLHLCSSHRSDPLACLLLTSGVVPVLPSSERRFFNSRECDRVPSLPSKSSLLRSDRLAAALLILTVIAPLPVIAQKTKHPPALASQPAPAAQPAAPATTPPGPAGGFDAFTLRQIGPFRGGRVDAVVGVPGEPLVYYFGGTGGGVFKTTDGGHVWTPITDGQINFGSIGSIAVADSDHNVIYVGTGESAIRGNASRGDGVYKSVDAGKTWTHVGLEDTEQIGQIRVDPKDPNLVY